MIQALIGSDEMVINWVARHLPQCPRDRAAAIGVTDDRSLIAGVVYSDISKNQRGLPINLHMTIAAESPQWALRSIIRILFAYPFIQIGVPRVTATVAKNNKRSRKLAEGLGFVHEGTLRRAWDGRQNALVYGMLRHECRWIGEMSDGKIESPSAARA